MKEEIAVQKSISVSFKGKFCFSGSCRKHQAKNNRAISPSGTFCSDKPAWRFERFIELSFFPLQ